MGERSIQRLRLKIIATMLGAFFLTMLLIAVLVNGAYMGVAQARMNNVLQSIIEHDGVLVASVADSSLSIAQRTARYFMVTLGPDGSLVSYQGGNDQDLDPSLGADMARQAVSSIFESGSVGDYYYKVVHASDGDAVVAFVDGSIELGEGRQVLSYTLIFLGGGLLLAFVLVWFMSRQAIRPEIEAARRQGEFITNASHELKTPLAVIRANTELQETLQGPSEWGTSTLRQVEYLDGLVRRLVEFSRDEEDESAPLEDVDVAAVVSDVAAGFASVARRRGISLSCVPEDGVVTPARRDKVEQLVRLLLDNATKYCDEGGSIVVRVSVPRRSKVSLRRRGARLVVSNSYANGEGVDFDRLFERFYRGDTSHSNQSGYGIGLAVAQRICEQAGGSICAGWQDGVVSFSCLLP
ncbi:cell wall metabolism sensor histidine kinase WalK [Olsenella sp. HMSC062G07]|uniref:sensor histidine kinase n=1 Tax=Olsenella sp. HMSC062G07 TaxID=1739330 RepID=UPI0008A2E7FE|nr:HAMP domain-containing sensor histidine kinase [Olsenella sp. HMSC062G07]OFK23545.1 hypothetical protein HMPREF2826_04560 [Olsenella sp. HMSC062G07]